MAKDVTKQYTVEIGGHEYTFTAHTTKSSARSTVNESLNPCLVEIEVGGRIMYDAFPDGHPLALEHEIIERCKLTANGMRWLPVERRDFGDVEEQIFERDMHGYGR